jgi:hypothetical protein
MSSLALECNVTEAVRWPHGRQIGVVVSRTASVRLQILTHSARSGDGAKTAWIGSSRRSWPALTPTALCDTDDMSKTLTIRVAAEEKAQWEKAAAAAKETVAEYVRGAVRQRTKAVRQSPWERHLGAANVAVPPPTNANIRRAFARRGSRKT